MTLEENQTFDLSVLMYFLRPQLSNRIVAKREENMFIREIYLSFYKNDPNPNILYIFMTAFFYLYNNLMIFL